jgi:SWI/SNF-related matrix-associated actin-dependent regulator 1 of chromatin subfamily A
LISPYQILGAAFLFSKPFALLADDMGLGKTLQAIYAAETMNLQSILVICPAVARVNWQREFKMWTLLEWEFQVCFGKDDFPTTGRVIVSYDYAAQYPDRLTSFGWDLVICDESHFIKEPEAKRTVSIYGKNGIIRRTKRLWCLSGTPAPNHVGELWPMLFTFGATRLSYEDFLERYCNCRPTFHGGQRRLQVRGTKKAMIPEIKELLKSVMLRRLKEEVMKELPPIKYDEVTVEPGPALHLMREEDVINYVREKDLATEVIERGGGSELVSIPDSVSTLRKFTGLQKVQPLIEMVSHEIINGAYDKIVIFAVHQEVIENLAEGLRAFGVVKLYGKTPAKERQENIDAFQNDKATRVFIGNITAAGTAITLTASCQVLFAELSWTPGDNAQGAMRAHRRGQTRPVFVRMATLPDSIDQSVTRVLKRKTEELTRIFNHAE